MMNYNLPKVPTILQKKRNECGLSALLMLFSYYGDKITIDEIRNIDKGEDLYTAKEIIEISQKHDYIAKCLKMKMNELLQIKFPCIVYFIGNHFVVYIGVRNGRVIYIDPAYGKRIVNVEEFYKRYQDIAIMIKPSRENTKKRKLTCFVRIENHLVSILLNIFNAIFLFMFIKYVRMKDIYIFALVLVVGVFEKILLIRSNIIIKTKEYKDSLLGQPILFFAYEENGLSMRTLIKKYIDYIVNQSIVIIILLFSTYYDNLTNVIQILMSAFLCALIKVLKKKQFFNVVTILANLFILIGINAFYKREVQQIYSLVVVYLFCRICMYNIKVERMKKNIDEANINNYAS